jgi:hypothetical protein
MLQNKLQSIKGQLLEMMFQQHINMNTEAPSEINYENFYEEVQSTINEIRGIKDLSGLEKFCEEYGLNDLDNEMSFPRLVEKAYK